MDRIMCKAALPGEAACDYQGREGEGQQRRREARRGGGRGG